MSTMQEQLKAEVEKQDWFILSKGQFHLSPPSRVNLEYKDEICQIIVYWADYKGTFIVHEFIHRGRSHSKRPKTVEDASEAICNIYSKAIERWDAEEEQKRQEEVVKQQRLQKRRETIKAFGLSLQSPILGSSSQYNEEFIFVASQRYQIQFLEIRDKKYEPERFTISDVSGSFTMEQIKNFITTMTECPQVMADRLLNGK